MCGIFALHFVEGVGSYLGNGGFELLWNESFIALTVTASTVVVTGASMITSDTNLLDNYFWWGSFLTISLEAAYPVISLFSQFTSCLWCGCRGFPILSGVIVDTAITNHSLSSLLLLFSYFFVDRK